MGGGGGGRVKGGGRQSNDESVLISDFQISAGICMPYCYMYLKLF